jgi:hypothetical protein
MVNAAHLTSNDFCSTALAALMFVCHQVLQVRQKVLKVTVPVVPKKTLSTQTNVAVVSICRKTMTQTTVVTVFILERLYNTEKWWKSPYPERLY